MSRRPSILKSTLFLLPALFSIAFISRTLHYALPAPVQHQYDPATNLPVVSEKTVLEYARHLSEDIGYRTVGTKEHAAGDKWMHKAALKLQKLCEEKGRTGRHLECEVWRQEGTGEHRFDMMGKRLYKTYEGLSNIVVRISNGTEEGKRNAFLVNAHLDSTLPSPGAADDALAVGVMLECMRVLVETPGWTPSTALIFLFNNAEESLQDGSHLYSTQHVTAPTVRGVLNLEGGPTHLTVSSFLNDSTAAGTMGPTLLFQATSEAMVRAYSHVPHPFGNIMANDIFASGILLSDTDFRQFEEYLKVPGLDMAIIGHSYFYHTQKDLVRYVEPGAAQHMADNTLALVKHLSSPEGPFTGMETNGTMEEELVRLVYMSVVGKFFFLYTNSTAVVISLWWLILSGVLAHSSVTLSFGIFLKGAYAIISAVVGATAGANVVALLMDRVLGKALSWFTSEIGPVFLFGPPAIAGALISQHLLPFKRLDERTMLSSVLLLQCFGAFYGQLVHGFGSSQVLFVSATSQTVALALSILTSPLGAPVPLFCYIVWQLSPIVIGVDCISSVLDFFVPLTGRIGQDAPAEHIIATVVALGGSACLPAVIPFFSRFPAKISRNTIVFLTAVTAVMMAIYSARSPFDSMHPRRVFLLHTSNVTSGASYLHISAADRAPGFPSIIEHVGRSLEEQHVVRDASTTFAPTAMSERNGDWDILYPFSAFLSPYSVPLDLVSTKDAYIPSVKIIVENGSVNLAGKTRKLTLKVNHHELIWTSIAFDAQVLSWSLDNKPPPEFSRHYVKEASFHGVSSFSLTLEIQLQDATDPRLRVNWIAIREDSMYPAKNKTSQTEPMKIFGNLDRYLQEKTDDSLDVVYLGCVAGVAEV